jgi:DNA-binding winged helix-turn-helix (wHTH) protein/TolB-like protein/Tfp pilus assembly protein PilF
VSDDRMDLVDGLTLDLLRGFLLHDGQPVHLRPQSYEVLKYLIQNRGRLISKAKLFDQIWEGRAVTDGSLVKCIEEIREALGPKGRQCLRTVRGRGYIFDPEPHRACEGVATPSAQPDVGAPASSELPAPRHEEGRFHWLPVAALVSASALLLSGVVLAFINSRSGSRAIASVAVLRFVHETGDTDLDYLSEGLADGVVTLLSTIPQLRVVAESSSFKYKDDVDPAEVGRALNVQAVVVGRIETQPGAFQIMVELVDARDRTHLWGKRYSVAAEDLREVRSDIGRAIAGRLHLGLTDAQERQLSNQETKSALAYEYYLNGVFYRRKLGFDNVRKALDYFTRATAYDPDFARAWAGIADADLYFAGNSMLDSSGLIGRARAAAQRALQQDQMLAEAHLAQAIIHQDEWEWAAAEGEYKRAISLNPSLVFAHVMYGATFLNSMGRHEEALAQIRRAEELDPLRSDLRNAEALALAFAGRRAEALEMVRRIEKNGTADTIRRGFGLVYALNGMHAEAVEEYRKAIQTDGETNEILCYLGYALALSGDTAGALSVLRKLTTTTQYVSPAELAIVYVGLGDKDRAFAMLEKAYAAHDLQMLFLNADRHYDSLRSDPRFADLIRRVGLQQ